MTADILRDKFLSFFKSRKHRIVESDSLVPAGDPTVLFTPAGMNQFKKEFLGFDSGFKRSATSQRCLRTDDLDKVGKTSVHHTFFEMLGNFSFGDYFKEEAIGWAWEFLTDELKIDKEKLWVSVYKDDEEAFKIWKEKIIIPEYKIIKLGDKENFWPSEAKEKGPNGPCGPCSEIFFDFGKDTGCRLPNCTPACNCGRFAEIWNLVFTQFNRKEGGLLEPLPNKNIDTGMGLERLAAVMQGVKNNFETDLFHPIIKEIKKIFSDFKWKAERNNEELIYSEEVFYAIADHIRAVVFAIYDGVLPSNEERGYVIRKLIRKSLFDSWYIGGEEFLYKLVPLVAEVMGKPYPELSRRKEDIAQVILSEEKNFISVLNSSNKLFKEKFASLLNNQNPETAGKVAFQLYDTYGIPRDLTVEWLDKNKIGFSQKAFNKELEEQKKRSRSQSAMTGDVFAVKDPAKGIKETKFSGYKEYCVKGKIIKIIKDDSEVKKISKGDNVTIILDKSVFYAASGGQVGDTGEFIKGKNVFEVLDTGKAENVILHSGRVKAGSFKKGDFVTAKINLERRLSIARNHTATHLLQAALRKVLGAHVQQQGSLVAEDRLRFDFSHFKGLDKDELDRIEELVNGFIISNLPVEVKQKALKEAKKQGALAFFGEKYGTKVRVVSIGDVSSELCAGSHLNYTGQIGLFKITQEGSVASGVRRIEAATGTFAYKIVKENEELLLDASGLLNVPVQKFAQELEKRNKHLKELEKQLNSQKLDSLKDSLDKIIQEAETIKDIKVITRVAGNLNMDLLRKNMDLIKAKTSNSVIALGASLGEEKALLVLGVTADLCEKGLDASVLIRDVANPIGGSGGGRKDFAQAGGNKPQNFPEAFKRLKEIIGNLK